MHLFRPLLRQDSRSSGGSADRFGGGTLCVSLDFELMWGAPELWARDGYGRCIAGERQAIPRILDLFERFGIHATWAAVGLAMAGSREEALHFAPELRPSYEDARYSGYGYLPRLGDSERREPLFFGKSLIERIAQTPGQEIGTHTYAHFYSLEPGTTLAQWCADLRAARAIAAANGLDVKSLVFPRNQYAREHIMAAVALGFTAFRGNERHPLYAPCPTRKHASPWLRALRLVDSYVDISGANTAAPAVTTEGGCDVPASRFLRPYARRLAVFDALRLARITAAMRRAAERGEIFHIWWHPHNFGQCLPENIAFLTQVLQEFARLRAETGMRALNMGEITDRA